MDPDNLTIDDLITLLKTLDNESIQIVDRDKNFEFRTKYNFELDVLIDTVRQLKKNELIKGPVKDDNPDRKHLLWIFRKKVRRIDCYIKLKIINKCKVAIVVSFHEWGLGGYNDGK